MDTPGVVYGVTTLPLCEYNVKYIYPQQMPPRRVCCIVLLVRSCMTWRYTQSGIKPQNDPDTEWPAHTSAQPKRRP